MTSPARVAANRSNALCSDRAKDGEGKLASSRNATRAWPAQHDSPCWPMRIPPSTTNCATGWWSRSPLTAPSRSCSWRSSLGVLWRLRRLRRVESALFTIGGAGPVLEALWRSGEADVAVGVAWSTHSPSFATLSRYEAAIFGRMRSCLTALQALQAARESDDAHIVVIPRSV